MRLCILFLGPADQDMEWTDAGIEGIVRFLRRLVAGRARGRRRERAGRPGGTGRSSGKAHETIAKVSDDIQRRFQFHTPISAVMELVNALSDAAPDDPSRRFAAETAVSLIQPYAPHFAEEVWAGLGHEKCLQESAWPAFDPALVKSDTVAYVVQVNGKLRGQLEASVSAGEDEVVALARGDAKVVAHLEGKTVRKVIFVPKRLVNFVVG